MALLYRVPRIVIGESRTFRGPEDYLRSRGVDLEIVDSAACRDARPSTIEYGDAFALIAEMARGFAKARDSLLQRPAV